MRTQVVIVFTLCVLFLLGAVDCKNGRKRGGKKINFECTDKKSRVGQVSSEDFAGKRVRLGCRKGGQIANIQLIGHNAECQGIPPDIYVETLKCYWERRCDLTYNKQSIMKVLPGSKPNESECVRKEPERFTLEYQCTKSKKVDVFDVTGSGSKSAQAESGVIRSHDDHPWLYKHYHSRGSSLTLQKPENSKGNILAYTVRTLNLWHHDKLTVTWEDESGEKARAILNDNVVTPDTTNLEGIEKVTFTLSSGDQTAGGDGFVICFQWSSKRVADACDDLIVPGRACKKSRGKGKKDKNKGRKKRDKN